MVKMTHVLVDRVFGRRRCESITVKEALDLRNEARRKGEFASFLCPICKQRARVHGGKSPWRGEHFAGDPKCEPNGTDCKES